MRDKPDLFPGDFFAIPGWSVVGLRGPDAVRFAQAQFMNDVASLPPGRWQWSGWLTPKGRVIALFALLRIDETTLLLLLADADPDAFVAQLQRFVFRSKLAIAKDAGSTLSGAFVAATGSGGGAIHGNLAEGGIELDLGGEGGPRTLRVGATPAVDDPQAQAHWLAFDLAHGLPRLPESQREQWTPQQLSLDRLQAFSVKKGCYPGQEIVARTHFLGKRKRGLVALRAAAPVPVEAQVELDGAAIGRIVSASPIEPHLALAVLPLEREGGALRAAGLDLEEVGLRGGLAR